MTIIIAHFTTTSGHFSPNCMFIFHKKEVQTVILRCLMGLNIDWFKNYGLRCKWRPRAFLANFQNLATDKWIFYNTWCFFHDTCSNLHLPSNQVYFQNENSHSYFGEAVYFSDRNFEDFLRNSVVPFFNIFCKNHRSTITTIVNSDM